MLLVDLVRYSSGDHMVAGWSIRGKASNRYVGKRRLRGLLEHVGRIVSGGEGRSEGRGELRGWVVRRIFLFLLLPFMRGSMSGEGGFGIVGGAMFNDIAMRSVLVVSAFLFDEFIELNRFHFERAHEYFHSYFHHYVCKGMFFYKIVRIFDLSEYIADIAHQCRHSFASNEDEVIKVKHSYFLQAILSSLQQILTSLDLFHKSYHFKRLRRNVIYEIHIEFRLFCAELTCEVTHLLLQRSTSKILPNLLLRDYDWLYLNRVFFFLFLF